MTRLDPLPAPAGVTVPFGFEFQALSSCRSCHTRIAWLMTPKGKQAPYNLDGTSHFATCPEAVSWRKNR